VASCPASRSRGFIAGRPRRLRAFVSISPGADFPLFVADRGRPGPRRSPRRLRRHLAPPPRRPRPPAAGGRHSARLAPSLAVEYHEEIHHSDHGDHHEQPPGERPARGEGNPRGARAEHQPEGGQHRPERQCAPCGWGSTEAGSGIVVVIQPALILLAVPSVLRFHGQAHSVGPPGQEARCQDCRKASRSALIVSASVVGIPCGNPG